MMRRIQSIQDLHAFIEQEGQKKRQPNIWAVYSRKSRFDPLKPGYSMEIQPDRAEEYARSQGAKDIRFYDDPGRSGKNSKRTGLQRMLNDIKAEKIDVVVVHRLDRAFRNLKSLLEFVELLDRHNVHFVSVTEQVDTKTWWGRLVMVVLGSLGESFLWQTSQHTSDGLAERRSKGLHLGRIPYGYCNGLCSTCTDENGEEYCPLYGREDRKESERGRIAVPHPIDRYAIPLIFQLYEDGLSFRDIAVYLKAHRFTLPDGTECQFRPRGNPEEHDEFPE